MPGRLLAMKFGKENPLQKSSSDRALGAIFSDGSQRHRVRSATGTPTYPWSAGM
jgi:hypothetical protein